LADFTTTTSELKFSVHTARNAVLLSTMSTVSTVLKSAFAQHPLAISQGTIVLPSLMSGSRRPQVFALTLLTLRGGAIRAHPENL
jgi:hypothetical protein